jgi:hypothetical protein
MYGDRIKMLTVAQKQSLWEPWAKTLIFADNGVYNYSPRHLIVRDFVQRGIFPFVKAKGYVFNGNIQTVTKSLLHYLFALYLKETVIFNNPHKEEDKEHFEEFEHLFDSQEMESFWQRWDCIEDFREDHYAHKLRYMLPYFIWAHLNLTNSPRYIKLEKLFIEVEQMEREEWQRDPKHKEDPYLVDTAKPNYEDHHWH